MRKLTVMLAFLLSGIGMAVGQVRPITGTVRNVKGEAVPFATVNVKGTNRSVTADANGYFSINATTGEVLVFSSTGQVAGEVAVGTGNIVNAQLGSAEGAIDEVVVTAQGSAADPRNWAIRSRSSRPRTLR